MLSACLRLLFCPQNAMYLFLSISHESINQFTVEVSECMNAVTFDDALLYCTHSLNDHLKLSVVNKTANFSKTLKFHNIKIHMKIY